MLGCRSRHIGKLRANPPPDRCGSRRVSTDETIFTPIGGRNDQNHQSPLRKPSKIGKIRNDTPQAGSWSQTGPGSGPWGQMGPGPKQALRPNGPWAQTGPGPKRALGPNGSWTQPGPGPNGPLGHSSVPAVQRLPLSLLDGVCILVTLMCESGALPSSTSFGQ